MKIFLAIIFFLLFVIHLNGQTKVMDHLFKDKPKDLSIFINPTFQYSEIAQEYCTIPGIGAGVIINKKIALGGVYNFTLNAISLPEKKGGGKLQMKWGGVHFEYTLWPLQKIHLSLPFSAGMGQLKISDNTNAISTGNANFIIAEPGLMIEINIWKYAKLGLGSSYRYIGNVSYNSLTSSGIKGFSAVASIKFGMFDYPELKKNKRDP